MNFWVCYNIHPKRSLWFECSVNYWITPMYCCCPFLVIWSYQILLSSFSEFWRSLGIKLRGSLIRSVHVLAYVFQKQKKAFGQLFLIISQMIQEFFKHWGLNNLFLPVLRDESVPIVSEFLYKPFAFLSVILLVLLSTAVF